MRASFLVFLLPLARAHPPVDVDANDASVLAAATAAAANASASSYTVLSAQRQTVSGLNYFLVLAVEQEAGWRLCSSNIYTSFGGAIYTIANQIEPQLESSAPIDDSAPDSCSAELASPSPLESVATVTVTEMHSSGGGGMMGGGSVSFDSHDEHVRLREAWRVCGGLRTKFVVSTNRTGGLLTLSLVSEPADAPNGDGGATGAVVLTFFVVAAAFAFGLWLCHKKAAPPPSGSASPPTTSHNMASPYQSGRLGSVCAAASSESSGWELNDAAISAGITRADAGMTTTTGAKADAV